MSIWEEKGGKGSNANGGIKEEIGTCVAKGELWVRPQVWLCWNGTSPKIVTGVFQLLHPPTQKARKDGSEEKDNMATDRTELD